VRVDALNRKLAVVPEATDTLAGIIDRRRSLRLERVIVGLIGFEIVITLYRIHAASGH
jgi:required for meiotic nuclear division protein 1